MPKDLPMESLPHWYRYYQNMATWMRNQLKKSSKNSPSQSDTSLMSGHEENKFVIKIGLCVIFTVVYKYYELIGVGSFNSGMSFPVENTSHTKAPNRYTPAATKNTLDQEPVESRRKPANATPTIPGIVATVLESLKSVRGK